MEDNNYIDEHLRRSLAGFSAMPDEDGFSEVLRRLEEKKKRRLLFWMFSGLGTAVLVGVALWWFTPQSISETKHQLTQKSTDTQVAHPATSTLTQNPSKESAVSASRSLNSSQASPMADEKRAESSRRSIQSPSHPTMRSYAANALSDHHSGIAAAAVDAWAEPSDSLSTSVAKDSRQEAVADVNAGAVDEAPFFLPVRHFFLRDTMQQEIIAQVTDTLPLAYAPLLTNEVRRWNLLLGLYASPQLGQYLSTANNQRAASYDSLLGSSFARDYAQQQNRSFRPIGGYALGGKLGMVWRNRWELWLDAGYQSKRVLEVVAPVPGISNLGGGLALGGPGNAQHTYTSQVTSSYLYAGLELHRNFQVHRYLRLNAGIGFRVSHVYEHYSPGAGTTLYSYDQPNSESLAAWSSMADASIGVVRSFGSRWEGRLSPGLYFAPGSLFRGDYVIRQRPYGIQLQGMLVFKILR